MPLTTQDLPLGYSTDMTTGARHLLSPSVLCVTNGVSGIFLPAAAATKMNQKDREGEGIISKVLWEGRVGEEKGNWITRCAH